MSCVTRSSLCRSGIYIVSFCFAAKVYVEYVKLPSPRIKARVGRQGNCLFFNLLKGTFLVIHVMKV
jgi:hypothetical protein